MEGVPLDTAPCTARLRLRAVSLADVELSWSASRVPGFNDGMMWDPPECREELISDIHETLRAGEGGRSFALTIERREPRTPVGRIGLGAEPEPGTWNLGFSTLGAERITAAHAVWNAPSRRVLEKLGFRFVRENACGFVKRGVPVPEREYVLDRSACQRKRSPPP